VRENSLSTGFVFWEDTRCLSRPTRGRVGHHDLTQKIGQTQTTFSFATHRTSENDKSPAMQGFSDAGGGTRTPDTRIMIGALPLVFA